MNTEQPWNAVVLVADLPPAGRHIEIEAAPDVRARLAKLADLRRIDRLVARFDLTPRGEAVLVTGTVSGQCCQTCVVSLEPLEASVEEAVDLRFVPGSQAEADELRDKPVQLDAEHDLPEIMVDGKLDLGAVATEFFMLGLDPYPRKPDAEFAAPAPSADDAAAHPFAALAALKKEPGDGA